MSASLAFTLFGIYIIFVIITRIAFKSDKKATNSVSDSIENQNSNTIEVPQIIESETLNQPIQEVDNTKEDIDVIIDSPSTNETLEFQTEDKNKCAIDNAVNETTPKEEYFEEKIPQTLPCTKSVTVKDVDLLLDKMVNANSFEDVELYYNAAIDAMTSLYENGDLYHKLNWKKELITYNTLNEALGEVNMHLHSAKKIVNKKNNMRCSLDYIKEGEQYDKQGDIENAIICYNKGLSYYEFHSWFTTPAYNRLLILYREKKDYDNEKRICKQLLHLNKNDKKILDRLVSLNTLIEKNK